MQTILTNLRIPEEDWLRVKTAAAALGISANEYIKTLIEEAARREFFAYVEKPSTPRKKARFYESLWRMIEKPASRKSMGASEEDKVIYSV